ncbi:MAG TPA: hypothetical protein PKW59_00310 [Thermotogota bacterium]|nr:hypothetical protein [Thermotogota bacterium]
MENNRIYPDPKRFILFVGALAFFAVFGFALQLELSVDAPIRPIERGTPFLVRYRVFDYVGDEKKLTLSLDANVAFSGSFEEYETAILNQTVKPFQELGEIDRRVEDGVISGGIVCSGAVTGTHSLGVLAFELDKMIGSESLEIEITENDRLSRALYQRWDKKSKTDHFGLTLLLEDAIFYNEQYAFTIIAAKKVNPNEKLDLSGFYYYTPSFSQAKALWYEVFLSEKLDQETYVIKMADIVVNPNPLLEEQTKVKIYHPYLQWKDASGNDIEDLSYEDEYETVLYQKPSDVSFNPMEPILLKTWEGSPALEMGEIGTVRLSIESRSLFLGSFFKMISAPSTATSITLRRSQITESQGIRKIDRTYHYEYDFLPSSPATYTLTLEPFSYTVTRTGENLVFQTNPLTIVVKERQNEPVFTGIINPLKPLREDPTRVKNKQQFEKGLLLAFEKKWEESRRVFTRLAEEEPLSDDIWYNLGWVAFYHDQVGLSQLCFYRAVAIKESEDTQYNIRFIETAKSLSGRPLAKVYRIDRQTHRWLGVGGIAFLAPFLFVMVVRSLRWSVFRRSAKQEPMKKRGRMILVLLSLTGIICLTLYLADLIRENAFERQTVVQYDSIAYAGPAFSYPAIGTVAKGNVGKRLTEQNGFSYIEYIALSPQDTPLSGTVTPSVRYWIPTENQEIILDSLFTE